jgi:hypothetical protein
MLNDLMGFDKFLAPVLIKIVYWIGIVLIVLGTLTGVVGGGMMMGAMGGYGGYGGGFNPAGALVALLAGAAGLLIWRVICEIWIVIFSINDRLAQIAAKP